MRYDDLYKALADEHRREIVTALCEQPVVAGDLARRVGLAPNALSFHLKWLRSAGLIDMQRRGRHLWYHLNGTALDTWREHVNTAFHSRPPSHLQMPYQKTLVARPSVELPVMTSTAAYALEEDVALPSELL